MTYPICAMRDAKVGFLAPTVEFNLEDAKRKFAHAMSQKDSIYNFAPVDFSLYKIADFDTESGEIIPCQRDLLIDGMQVINHE